MRKKLSSIGICVIFLGIAMAVFGVSLFSYQGHSLNPVVSEMGKYSFHYFFETILIGVVVLVAAQFVKK